MSRHGILEILPPLHRTRAGGLSWQGQRKRQAARGPRLARSRSRTIYLRIDILFLTFLNLPYTPLDIRRPKLSQAAPLVLNVRAAEVLRVALQHGTAGLERGLALGPALGPVALHRAHVRVRRQPLPGPVRRPVSRHLM